MHMLPRSLVIATVGVALTACISTPTVVSHKGLPVTAINAVSMSCSDPYALAQDCSVWSGATLRVKLSDLTSKVAGTSDGRVILVMSEKRGLLTPTQYQAELAADAVQAAAATVDAKLLKLEGLATGGSVPGYILHFDKDVYTTLKKSAVES
jgi:hypothetical protein